MRTMVATDRLMYERTLPKSRDGRVRGFVPTATCVTAIRCLPAWMSDSSVYEKSETIVIRSAASRVYARKPLVVSGTFVAETRRTAQLPTRCSSFRRPDLVAESQML